MSLGRNWPLGPDPVARDSALLSAITSPWRECFDGGVKSFKIEMGPPYALTRGGWTRETVKVGDKVTVEAAALAKDGSNAAGSEQTTHMILANGQKLPMR